MVGIIKTFINQYNILVPRVGPARELVVCTILRDSPMEINRILCDNGLDIWCIKKDKKSTLCKIAILYQLANGCVEYTREFGRMYRLLEAHVNKMNLETPNLVKSI